MKYIIYLLTIYFNIMYVSCVCSEKYGIVDTYNRLDILDGTKTIQHGSFNGCTSLKTVFIPDSVSTIGEYAFANSGIQRVLGGEGLHTLGNWSFANCSHLRLIDAQNITSWNWNAINNTHITSFTFKPATFIYYLKQKDDTIVF